MPPLHHRLVASKLAKAPKAAKGQKKGKMKRDLEGPAVLYYRKITGTHAPSVSEPVRR